MSAVHITFFESLLVLLLTAIALMQISRRIAIPYPSMLALAGIGVGFLPGTPKIEFDPETMLALFIAPALVDAAFDFPLAAIKRLWRPLVALAVIAVLLTTAAVGWIGYVLAGLPIAAAIALGAIVAPPDAAAATALAFGVLATPHHGSAEGREPAQRRHRASDLRLRGRDPGQSRLQRGDRHTFRAGDSRRHHSRHRAGALSIRLSRHVRGTLGGSLLEFVSTFSSGSSPSGSGCRRCSVSSPMP